MARRALCVGINEYPIQGADLRGCVNDAQAWAGLLADRYDFARSDITMITDADATKAGMMAGLEALLAGAQDGDVLVFTNSSHGSYQLDPDAAGDEAPGYDEVLCPYDIQDEVIVDDELRELFDGIPRGVRLSVISDSCHSGSVTRAIPRDAEPDAPDGRRPRFLTPSLWGGLDDTSATAARGFGAPRSRSFPQSSMNHVLLSGCMDVEVSYDAMIGDRFHGAMSYHALKALREADHALTYRELADAVSPMVLEAGYPQHPQLEGRSDLKHRPVFT